MTRPTAHPEVPPPRALQVEVSGACNLSCRMCLVAYRPRLGRSTNLALAALQRLLDGLPTVRELTLQGLGEPLLVPHLEDLVAEAVSRGIRVGFNTNGTLLTAERSAGLVASGLDWLHVSIDGATTETFAAIRHGGDLDTVVANLRGLVAARVAAGAADPRIQVNTVVMRRNLHELPAIVRLAADVGVDRMWVQGLSHDFSDVAPEPGFVEIRRWTERATLAEGELLDQFGAAAAVASELGLELRLPETGPVAPRGAGEPACDWPWRSLYVNHDGTVQPCCMLMGRQRGVMGHVEDGPLGELWHGDRYRDLRDQLSGDEAPDMCRGCSAYRQRF